jgi:hypothetical protein
MAKLQAPCPACAAPVEFKAPGSMVAICPYCSAAVARGDKALEDHGKISDLVDTQSPLSVGIKGKFRGKPYRIVGRLQYRHPAGGVWDEWYAQFPNGKWGLVSEAQGRFYMTFQQKLKEGSSWPNIATFSPGEKVTLKETEFTVSEVSTAEVASAEGEIPFPFEPNGTHPFVDLYGPNGQFVSLDYGNDGAKAFFGWQVSLGEIGLSGLKANEREARVVESKKVSCPNCAGSLELRAPDETMRVTCPFCNSLLDCKEGNLEYLETLKAKVSPLIELGSTGQVDGIDYTLIGFMQRSVTYDKKYYWTEYLLYNPGEGFHWLVNATGHWSIAKPLSPADVHDYKHEAIYDGKTFKLFERGMAQVEYVLGEMYWKVEIGEEVATRDLVCPPLSISVERTMAPQRVDGELKMGLGEVNMTLSRYMTYEEVEEAFGVEELPRSWEVAPNQPSPCDGQIYVHWAMFLAALFLIWLMAKPMFGKADGWLLFYAMLFVSVIPIGSMLTNYFFDVKRWSESDFSPYSTE